jgi:2-oxoglutarate dehydrogenase E1 component
VPGGFAINEKLRRILDRRLDNLQQEKTLDWAWAEMLAFATLLVEGVAVRLSGEDSRRGTFSQRHCVWFDTETGTAHAPLAHLADGQAPFRAYDSPLSEAGVVGFEYGYAAVDPHSLVVWEAQYGDFANGAQVIVDQFVASGEAKWQRSNGLVMLLPHGYEGQGPDHSTARLERYLQLCAGDNLQVCQPSTPAQYFHLLRRQVKRAFRKPLVVLTPKSLLRHPKMVSSYADLASGSFQEVLDDPVPATVSPRRVLLCSGKAYFELLAGRSSAETEDVALLRLEQFYPFPENRLRELVERYESAAEWCWVQEEPRNMGAWTFLAPRLEALLGRKPAYIGRPEAGSPATGFPFIHREEQESLVREALGREETGKEGRGKRGRADQKKRVKAA